MQIQYRKKTLITDIGYTIRLDEKLLKAIQAKATEKDMSANLYINTLLIKDVEGTYTQ